MNSEFIDHLKEQLAATKTAGLYKDERVLKSQQSAHITADDQSVINLCANNYLGLANHPRLIEAAKGALDELGFGMSSVRFICGTHVIHKKLESKISRFLKTEDTILYSSCFDANTGLFETLLNDEDAIISDSLNHASIIDGVRLCKARRFRYRNNDMDDLEAKLKESTGCRFRLVATDGVFSMDGIIANLPVICDLAEKYNAMVMVDDSHAVGFMGQEGRGTHEYRDVVDRVDIITGTLGKALGGASGGYTTGRKEIIEWLRQRSRPYLFSNTLAPVIAATSIEVLTMLEGSGELRARLHENSRYFRREMETLGFQLVPGEHPIIPVMIGDAVLAQKVAADLLEEGVYAIGFSFPVVPKGQARIRTQMSSALSRTDVEQAVSAFANVGRKNSLIS